MRSARSGLREAIYTAIKQLEDERLHPATRVNLALGVLRSALLRSRPEGRKTP